MPYINGQSGKMPLCVLIMGIIVVAFDGEPFSPLRRRGARADDRGRSSLQGRGLRWRTMCAATIWVGAVAKPVTTVAIYVKSPGVVMPNHFEA